MKLIAVSLASITLVASACATSPARSTNSAPQPAVAPAGNVTGGTDARNAVIAFLDAAKSQDLQALASAWGSSSGSVRDAGQIPREEMEKRELVMMCYLAHDSHTVISDAQAPNNERVVVAQLRRGPLTRSTNFYTVPGPDGRWYVRSFDMEALTDFCKANKR